MFSEWEHGGIEMELNNTPFLQDQGNCVKQSLKRDAKSSKQNNF